MKYCLRCEAQITSTDYEAGECTQCGEKILPEELGQELSRLLELEAFL